MQEVKIKNRKADDEFFFIGKGKAVKLVYVINESSGSLHHSSSDEIQVN